MQDADSESDSDSESMNAAGGCTRSRLDRRLREDLQDLGKKRSGKDDVVDAVHAHEAGEGVAAASGRAFGMSSPMVGRPEMVAKQVSSRNLLLGHCTSVNADYWPLVELGRRPRRTREDRRGLVALVVVVV